MSEKIKIAIVDDHALFRKSLTVLINLFANYHVSCDASNGKDFIAQLKPGNLPDIVLMDINMPVMDGYATTAWLRANYPAIKTLALSTMDAEAAIIKMIKSGAKGYVLKDADPAELKLAFDELTTRGYFYNELVTRKVMNSVMQLTEAKNSAGLFAKLSDREIEFLKLTCTEFTYKEIADKLFVSVRTAEGYRDILCEKLELKTRVGLAMYAIKNNLVTL
ncbi:response regulator transcription factor [Mucilaginibacter sp. KACC 22773]|uniref:response regulator transcription factor n=1 Tax=Mucilaginibacter sp. KACC 22773 TaxID=3025671 RepID=UPI00236562C3|nr:response regulator transcription factor [Mucilaginibacter sp. KACC 22773]WDF77774.1 response regulator transcription factor [Mucilaginibacter sp. KACC 22773]